MWRDVLTSASDTARGQPSVAFVRRFHRYNFPNVSAALGNNTLLIERTIGEVVHERTVTSEDGLYGGLDDVQRVIPHSLLQDSNFSVFTISIVGVAATQKAHISITTNAADSIILRFAAPNSIGGLLGFTNDKIFWPFSTTSCASDTTASLDRTTSVFVTTSLCSGSVVAGKGGQSTLAVIHLAAFQPASVVAFTPNKLLEVPAENIAGASVTNATFALVNQNMEDLDTLNAHWQLVLEVVW